MKLIRQLLDNLPDWLASGITGMIVVLLVALILIGPLALIATILAALALPNTVIAAGAVMGLLLGLGFLLGVLNDW